MSSPSSPPSEQLFVSCGINHTKPQPTETECFCFFVMNDTLMMRRLWPTVLQAGQAGDCLPKLLCAPSHLLLYELLCTPSCDRTQASIEELKHAIGKTSYVLESPVWNLCSSKTAFSNLYEINFVCMNLCMCVCVCGSSIRSRRCLFTDTHAAIRSDDDCNNRVVHEPAPPVRALQSSRCP